MSDLLFRILSLTPIKTRSWNKDDEKKYKDLFMKVIDDIRNKKVPSVKWKNEIYINGVDLHLFLTNLGWDDGIKNFVGVPSLKVKEEALYALKYADFNKIKNKYTDYMLESVVYSLLTLYDRLCKNSTTNKMFISKLVTKYGPGLYSTTYLISRMKVTKIDYLVKHGVVFPSDCDTYGKRMGYMVDKFFFYNMCYRDRKENKEYLERGLNLLLLYTMMDNQFKPDYKYILDYFTDAELIEHFSYVNYKGRDNLIHQIRSIEENIIPPWGFFRGKETNGKMIDLLTGDERRETTSPTLSYGNIFNYRIFTIPELITMSKDGRLLNPDYTPKSKDIEEFSREDILSLKYNLKNIVELQEANINSKIYEEEYMCGVYSLLFSLPHEIKVYNVKDYRNMFLSLSKNDKVEVEIYISFVVILSLFMRFWKGYNCPFDYSSNDRLYREYICNVYFDIRSRLLEEFTASSVKFINLIPTVTKDGILRVNKLDSVIYNNIGEVNHCSADTSDILLTSVYYVSNNILNKNINDLIKDSYNYLTMMEREVIELYINLKVATNKDKYKVYKRRLSQLDKETGVIHKFDISKMKSCVNTDDLPVVI